MIHSQNKITNLIKFYSIKYKLCVHQCKPVKEYFNIKHLDWNQDFKPNSGCLNIIILNLIFHNLCVFGLNKLQAI